MVVVKTLSENLTRAILHFLVKNVFFNKDNFISQKYLSLTETWVTSTGNILWKFELDQIIFQDYTGIGVLNTKK